MSFASSVKDEVARLDLEPNVKKAQLCAVVKLLSVLGFSSNGMSLTIRSKNATVIKMLTQDFEELYDVKPGLGAIKETKLDKANIYVLVVEEKVKDILKDLDLWTDSGLQQHPRMKFLATDNMIKGYLTGCFLATGSVNSPTKTNYHMEVVANEEEHAKFIAKLLNRFYINAKIQVRRNQFVVYVKASEQISDYLRLMGASNAVMDFEDIRIQRDFVNSISRLNNCELANDAKSLAVAARQYEAVEYIIENHHLEKLTEKDQEMALLRFENPEASLLELSDLYLERTGVVISKSGVRHRFVKIIELADKYRQKEEQ